ncbi:MAG: SDR family oxidoreductase [Planctomycetes bacterium]|nr:SDR family oxidoreductase [Planctomycetota bacterium]
MAEREAFDFSGRVVWITGAARGIGLTCAEAFHARGARVVGIDVKPGTSLAKYARAVELNIADPKAVAAAGAELASDNLAPDVLVNNAGITRDGVMWKLQTEDWTQVLDVNLNGAFYMMREAVPLMRSAGGGAIVNITSINGERGKFGQTNYSAAKAGLIGLTKSGAREGGRFGIRVNAVSPGMIETELAADLPATIRDAALAETALGRLGATEDVANAVLFLASPLAAHITGQVIRVDGGQYM